MQTYHTHSKSGCAAQVGQRSTEKPKHCSTNPKQFRSGSTDHSKFGGIIYASDFNTDRGRKLNTDGSPIARRILSDQKFDRQCQNRIASDQNFDRQHKNHTASDQLFNQQHENQSTANPK